MMMNHLRGLSAVSCVRYYYTLQTLLSQPEAYDASDSTKFTNGRAWSSRDLAWSEINININMCVTLVALRLTVAYIMVHNDETRCVLGKSWIHTF